MQARAAHRDHPVAGADPPGERVAAGQRLQHAVATISGPVRSASSGGQSGAAGLRQRPADRFMRQRG